MGHSQYVLSKENQFKMNVIPKDTSSSKVVMYGLPNGSSASRQELEPGDYTVDSIDKNNPDWIHFTNAQGKGGWINIGLSQGSDTAIPVSEEDKLKLTNALYELSLSAYAGAATDENYMLESSPELQAALADTGTITTNTAIVDTYSGKILSTNEMVVEYTQSVENTVDDMYKHYLILSVKAYGGPPQWTPYVDPRISHVKTSYGIDILVGRKFANTVIAAPTILSLCPGVIKYNSVLGAAMSNSVDEDELVGTIAEKSGRIVEFQPCWNREVSKNKPYMKYVNTLNQITAIAMSRAKDNTATESNIPLSERPFPGTGTPYYKFDWTNYDDPDNSVSGIFGGFDMSSISSTFDSIGNTISNFTDSIASSAEAYKYVNFYCSGSNSTKESFETSVRSTQIEDLINSNISSIVKDVAYFTGGVFSDGANEDIQKWADSVSDELGGVGNLLQNVFQLASGGKIEFPQVVDDCTFGKECQFTVRFVAGSADVESRYLMRCEFNHFLALILPRQLETSLNMYACPFMVRSICPGRHSCEIGVITGVNINYGGSDDNAWTINAQPTEIEVTFGITPLYNKLFMSASDQLQTYFLKNSGMIEYIVSNCGVDMRLSQLELKAELITGMAKGYLGTIPNSIIAPLFDNAVINAIRQLDNF